MPTPPWTNIGELQRAAKVIEEDQDSTEVKNGFLFNGSGISLGVPVKSQYKGWTWRFIHC